MVVGFLRSRSPIVVGLIGLVLVTSLVAALAHDDGGGVYGALWLMPMQVMQGQLWRLVTWPLVETGPLSLVYACIALYWFGGDLASVWGDRRFARFVVAVVLVTGVATTALAALVSQAWMYPFMGGRPVGNALVIAWALQFPLNRIRVYRVLVVGGPLLAYGMVAVTLLYAAFFGLAYFLPELIASLTALAFMTGGPSRLWRLARRRLRDLRGLRGMDGGRHGGPYRV